MNKKTNKWYADLGNGKFRNPILYTDYSDPDAIRVGDDYFMTASSFCNSPGLPVLHSKDMVNWKVISYAIERIPGERYENPQHGCGVWAPAIRYKDEWFYIIFPMPDEGIFMTKTKNPWGNWSEPVCIYQAKGWIDPCPFWDDDGNAYMVSAFAKSRIGFKSILHISKMKPDCSGLLDDGVHVFDGNENNQETIEGPKLYKRNGYYYIFAPAGGVKTGWQVVLRSKNIYGPYEYKNVLVQGSTNINGPHQGAWVDTQTGEDWFIHFQDVYGAGRIIHLQPVEWIEDWPVIGRHKAGELFGEPVLEYKKPDVGAEYPIEAPDAGDDFSKDRLGLQWQWNSNYKKEWYEADADKKVLRLFAYKKEKERSLSDVKNLLLQKWCMPEFEAETKLNLIGLKDGDTCGMVSMGMTYGAAAIRKENGTFKLITISGEQKFKNEKAYAVDNLSVIEEYSELNEIYFKNVVRKAASVEKGVPLEKISFEYSLDGESYKEILSFASKPGRWVGIKNGIFCFNESDEEGGFAEAEYFNIY